jgi:O-antigen ligase
MYLNFAVLVLYYYLIFDKENFVFRSVGIYILLIVIFSFFIVLLSSKIGLITLLFIIFVGTFFWFIRSLAVFPSILVFTMLTTMIYVSFKYSSLIQGRIQEAVVSLSTDTPSQSTTGARLIIWDISYDLILAKPLMGYGTGDVKYELVKKYEELNYEHLYEGKLNAHNQYVQTLLAIGIIGSLFFWLYLYFPMIKLKLFRNFVYFGFIVLITFNFLTESMLETQAGVIFYAFFNALLYFNQDKIVQLNFKRS